jgi:hypothetical protein
VTVVVKGAAGISLHVVSPVEGELITGRSTRVSGTIANTTGGETGVTVNGVVALVSGGRFVANRVPLGDGENIITAAAMDISGNSVSDSVTISADTESPCLEITATSNWGVSPLETTLKLEGLFNFTNPSLSYVGPGEVELLESMNDREFKLRFVAEGLYEFTAEAADPQNNTYSASVSILVLNRNELDGLLRTKWNGMKQGLTSRNIEQALRYFLQKSGERYRPVFSALAEKLPGIVSDMQEIELIYSTNGVSKYRINRVHIMDGEPVTITYYISFAVDDNGIWKLDQF